MKKNDTEDADAAEFAWRHADGVPRGGLSHDQTACEPVSPGGR